MDKILKVFVVVNVGFVVFLISCVGPGWEDGGGSRVERSADGEVKGNAAVMVAHYIDVGQGDAALLEFPCGVILVDAGGQSKETNKALVGYLDKFFTRRADLNRTINAVVITHPHLDHTRGIREVMSRFKVLNYVDNGQICCSGKYDVKWVRDHQAKHGFKIREVGDSDFAGLNYKQGVSGKMIDPLKCADCDPVIQILSGQRTTRPGGWSATEFKNANNHSLIVRVDFGESSFLFTGDMETDALDELVEHYDVSDLLDVDVYQVGHHASKNGTTVKFMREATPEISLISCGKFEVKDRWTAFDYGHPHRDAVTMLDELTTSLRASPMDVKVGIKRRTFEDFTVRKAVYATAWDGTVKVTADLRGKFKVVRGQR